MPTSSVLIDDRLLVARLTGAAVRIPSDASVATTSYWYYRACRAAILGSGGQLSGPFVGLDEVDQACAIAAMLHLPDDIGLPDARPLVPAMVDLAARHPRLNVMNLEAAAAARLSERTVLLSPVAADGVLPPVLDAEAVGWDIVEVPV